MWVCRCECGETISIRGTSLRHKTSQSCGCYLVEATKQRSTTHGQARHPLYATWNNMRRRCLNPASAPYKNYGGRGIEVFEEWKGSPTPFIEWIEENLGPRPAGMTLDRINNDGNYEPGNLRWSTAKEQRDNQNDYRLHPDFYKLLTEPLVWTYSEGPSVRTRIEVSPEERREDELLV